MNNNTPPNNKGNGNNNGGKAPKNTQNMLMFAVFVIAAILVWALFNNQYTQATSQEITYDKFLDMLEADEVASVEDTGSTWKITPKEKDGIVKRNTVKGVFNNATYINEMIVTCMETPNLKDAELCSFYGVMDPTEVPGLMFTIGEKNLVMDAVSEINDVKMASELKNAAKNF